MSIIDFPCRLDKKNACREFVNFKQKSYPPNKREAMQSY